jgi:superfamily II DNA or RNA helicase
MERKTGMEFILNNRAIMTGIKPETGRHIRNLFTIENPKFTEAEKMGRYTGDLEPELRFYDIIPGGLSCPRGAAGRLYDIYTQHGEQVTIMDDRLELTPVDFQFHGSLRPLQEQAVKDVLQKQHGTLSAPTGSGKTTMGLFIIAQRKQPALIVVHTRELVNQWVDAIGKFLHIPPDQVGIIGGGKFSIGNKITVALVQSLYKRLDDVVPYVGHIIVDECHRTPSRVFTQAVDAFPAIYRLGLTATPWRRDRLSRAIFWHLGDVTGQIEKAELLDQGNLCHAHVKWVETSFSTALDASEYYSKVLSELTQDLDRNLLIAETVTMHNGTGISLILSDRRDHCETLADILRHRHGIETAVLTGQTPAKEREQIVRDLQSGSCRYLVATGQLIGEGFDLPGIEALVLATPLKFSGRLIQYIGRALRLAPGKDEAVIIDFVDHLEPVFAASARHRADVYRGQGIGTES